MICQTVRPCVCARCAPVFFDANLTQRAIKLPRKGYTTINKSSNRPTIAAESEDKTNDAGHSPGPMARRLEEATEEALFTGGKAGRRAIEDAGFSEELKEKLLARVKDAKFRSEHASAFAEAGMPASAGQGSRAIAASQPWTGEETTRDTVLRMLTDAHKPLKQELRGGPNMPDLQPVDMRIRHQRKQSPGHRAANARDKASVYAGLAMKELDGQLGEKEKAARMAVFRERFQPGARAMPNIMTGLASLANERIEDAIARGQFKNIPRGKGIERDTRSDNPFIDTTEYIMNKMIKRQDIVPPWIEKQQEIAKTAANFRARLRNDWKRHAARTIASKGGSLEAQMERARLVAKAEELHNPRKRNVDQMAIPTNSTDDVVMVKIRQQTEMDSPSPEKPGMAEGSATDSEPCLPAPFRDPDWLRIEQSYLELAINNLNTLTRSYNLMAPELAKKPYFSLERELNNCYADIAPLLPDEIKERATLHSKPSTVGANPSRPGSILDRFGSDKPSARIYDSKAPLYGFKEMWRDLFNWRKS